MLRMRIGLPRCKPSPFINSCRFFNVKTSKQTQNRTRLNNFPIRKYSATAQNLDPFHLIYSFGAGTEGAPLGHDDKPNSVLTPRLIESLSIHNTNPALGRPTRKRRFLDVNASYLHAFAVSESGEVFGWGLNTSGQLAAVNRAEMNIVEPTFIDILQSRRIISTACGRAHSLFVTDDNQVLAVGANDYAQLGLGHKNHVKIPASLDPLKGEELMMVECGLDHNLALSDEGRVWVWGYNGEGQLGLSEDVEAAATPTELILPNEAQVCSIAAGFDFSVFLTVNGDVYTAGSNSTGQLGLGHTNETWVPSLVPALKGKNVALIAAGGSSAFALAEDGTLYSWGFSSDGQLGRITEEQQDPNPAPIEFFNGKQIQMLKSGGGHTLVLLEDGLYSFGYGSRGRLGHGDEQSVNSPKKIQFFKDMKVVNFACGMDTTFVVTEDPDEEEK